MNISEIHMQFFSRKILLVLLILTVSIYTKSNGQRDPISFPQKISDWNNVSGFAISPDEKYMVLSIRVNGKEELYESFYKDNFWSEPKPITVINNYKGGANNIGGPFLYYDSRILYFHADFPGSIGGHDIYYSEWTSNGWSEPVNLGHPVNSDGDEFYPSVLPGGKRLYFERENPDTDLRKPRRTPECRILYYVFKDPQGNWEAPLPLHDVINSACEHGLFAANDGKTIFFSSVDQENHRDGYNVYYAREILRGAWVKPILVDIIASGMTIINPRLAGENLYYVKQDEGRRAIEGSIYKVSVPSEFSTLPTVISKGKIVMLENEQPIYTQLTVFDPTTLKVLGNFYNDRETGKFNIPLLDYANYIVDVRAPGYSFASFQLDFRKEEKLFGPELIKLFNETELFLSVYDAEIFRPLNVDVWVEILSSEADSILIAENVEPGIYKLPLPIGKEYIVKADSDGFTGDSFNFDLLDDVVFSQFHRSLLLEPIKQPVDFYVRDSESGESLAANILITNLNREETIFFSASDFVGGKTRALLREGDSYEFTVTGAQGYSFHNQVFNVGEDEELSLNVELVPLRAQTAIRLNDVYFATNSAELTSESFAELDRVVDLIITNPDIVIEISAHTCDLGSVAYNNLLSERRAQSVVSYLLENEVPDDHLVAKGYGMHNPVVPNSSDENRAMNRRVEFKVIDIRETDFGFE